MTGSQWRCAGSTVKAKGLSGLLSSGSPPRDGPPRAVGARDASDQVVAHDDGDWGRGAPRRGRYRAGGRPVVIRANPQDGSLKRWPPHVQTLQITNERHAGGPLAARPDSPSPPWSPTSSVPSGGRRRSWGTRGGRCSSATTSRLQALAALGVDVVAQTLHGQ